MSKTSSIKEILEAAKEINAEHIDLLCNIQSKSMKIPMIKIKQDNKVIYKYTDQELYNKTFEVFRFITKTFHVELHNGKISNNILIIKSEFTFGEDQLNKILKAHDFLKSFDMLQGNDLQFLIN
ncbi:MAG: hypothetical protein COA66_10235 [Arcobacter sp.]|nr:MAG: hypothetical protein COA66_10235 [Arcobacter sp.]